jgi:hypothetical protein
MAQVVKTEIVYVSGNPVLYRAGEPYYILGAGGDTHLDKLIETGGNSIRTWSTDHAGEIPDMAQEKGLTVMLGLWVGVERQGFDYNNEEAVKAQFEKFREVVLTSKDHPALLLWGIGNEVDLEYTNYKVWDAVQDIAEMIHNTDKNHPTSTVTAGLNERDVKLVMERAPDIDIFSVNTYGDLCNVKQNIRKFGWTGTYIIAEWGPNGHWEVPKTKWAVPVEQTSREKAISYYERYNNCIITDKNCVGSYVFLWGQKQETTGTWYGVFTKNGNPTEVIDYIQKSRTGQWHRNRAPSLDSVFLVKNKPGDSLYIKAENIYDATVYASDENENLIYDRQIIPESDDIKSGGDFERTPGEIKGLIKNKRRTHITFRAPSEDGAYRLFVYVSDSENKTVYANIPFYILPRNSNDDQSKPVKLKKQTLHIEEM